MRLVDTDVLIWNLRGNVRAADRPDAMPGFLVSAVTYMALVQGVCEQLKDLTPLPLTPLPPVDQALSGSAPVCRVIDDADQVKAAEPETAGPRVLPIRTR